MSKRLRLPAVARHIQIYEEDWEFLEAHFGISTPKGVGVNACIREIVHSRVKSLRAAMNARIDEVTGREASNDAKIAEGLR